MDQEAPTVRAPRGAAVVTYEAGMLARDEIRRWFVRALHEAGWPPAAIGSHFGLSEGRISQIVAAAPDDYVITLPYQKQ